MGSYSQISPDGNGPQQSSMGLCAMTEAGAAVGFLSPFSQPPLSCRVWLMLCYVLSQAHSGISDGCRASL